MEPMTVLRRVKAGFIFLALLALAHLGWKVKGLLTHPVESFARPLAFDSKPLKAETVLGPGEAVKVTLKGHSLTEATKGSVTVKYVPSAGTVTTVVKADGSAVTTVKSFGWSLKPGIGAMYADQPRFAMDAQVAYWGRLSLHLGAGVANAPVLLPFVAAGYRLDHLGLANTSIGAGMTWRKEPLVLIRVEL